MQVGWLGCLRAQPVDAKVPYLRLARRRPTASTTDRAYVRAIPASPDSSGPGTSPRVLEYARVFAGALLTLAVAWSTPLGQISPDTKTDLYVDAWGFMARALHLWDPQVTWGVLQNQGYGYLFPMGPFFAVLGSVLPTWVAQRLWWSVLLLVGYLGMLWLLREFGVRNRWAVHLSALAFALSPRVITTLGGLSSEALPTLVAPLVLAPLVASSSGRMGTRRAAALSGLAILGCGGINATATLFAVIPAGLWLVTRRRWWRQRLTAWWALAVVCATSWWVGPLLLLGEYSPPFLDWIENSKMVSTPAGLLDTVRGTSHWLGHLLTPHGPWWPAGYALVSDPWVILATALLAALGLAGLATRTMPHRGFSILLLLLGLLVIAIPHPGPLSSPWSTQAQDLLDGPLSALRNVHKADPLIRLAIIIGLAHLLDRIRHLRAVHLDGWAGAFCRGRERIIPAALTGLVAISVVWGASPGIDGNLAPRGTFAKISEPWQEAADWLSAHSEGDRSLIIPAASFGEYTWGRPLDEPLRPLTDAPYAVRDAVPLTPANTVRFLDAVEQRLQTGRDLEDAVSALARTGIRFLVLRNDLDTSATGLPPVLFAGSSLRSTPSVEFVAGFGERVRDVAGVKVSAVEIYEIRREVAAPVELWPVSSVPAVAGASEVLPALATLAAGSGPVILDGDVVEGFAATDRIETDGYRARERFFGVTRGQDVTSSLSRDDDETVPDYRPWADRDLRSVVDLDGAKSVTASSSIATDSTIMGLRPAHRPFAAVDGDSTTAWLTFGDNRPTLTITLDEPVSPAGLSITPVDDDDFLGRGHSVPTRVRVITDAGSVVHELDPHGGQQPAPGVGELTEQVQIEIVDTTRGAPSGLTGLADVSIPGVTVRERIVLRAAGPGVTRSIVLGAAPTAMADGCLNAGPILRCVSNQFRAAEETVELRRSFPVAEQGQFTIAGGLVADPLRPIGRLLVGPQIEDVTASSVRTPGAAGAPTAAFDQDPRTAWSPGPGDSSPQITATFRTPVTVNGLRVQTRDRWTRENTAFVRVAVDGQERFGRLTRTGELSFDPVEGRTVSITFVREASGDHYASLEIEEVEVAGAEVSPPEQSFLSECGQGPDLTVNEVPVPTRVSSTREAALGFGVMGWVACAPVGFGYLPEDTLAVSGWEGATPSVVVVSRDSASAGAPLDEHEGPTSLTGLDRPGPTEVRGVVADGPDRILVMTDNANPGWEATVDGVTLAPVTVDGFRQGFIVPEGVTGSLTIRFGPDAPYRAALLAGLCLALLLLPLTLLPDKRRVVLRAAERHMGQVLGAAATVVIGGVLAGIWGVVLAAAAVLALQSPAVWRTRVVLVATAVVTAGVVEVLVGEPLLNETRVEAVSRILTLLAICVVVATQTSTPAARRSNS